MQKQLLIASNNADKVIEFRGLLQGSGWEVLAPSDLGLSVDVEETGTTYSENARIKAEAFCEASMLPALADDSGLEVDALHGEPGALHHLNGWDGTNQAERIQILLAALKDASPDERKGRYKAVLYVAFPDGSFLEEDGACEGVIIHEPTGVNGFGYDPVFFLPDLGITMAELPTEEKNRISHRAVAAHKLVPRLRLL